jgi:beta-lactamase regulating signal transducer with metallopeptidase domain
MDPALLALARYSAQILIVVCVAAAAATLLCASAPSFRFAYWRTVGALCLVVPWLPVPAASAPAWSVEFGIAAIAAAEPATALNPVLSTAGTAILWIVAAGILARLGWLLMGAYRLRQIRRRSVPADVGADIDQDRRELAPHAEIRWSAELTHPATFGIRRPVVLLPARFAELSAPSGRAVVRHELLHIARGDWIWIVIEEHVRALFWFHPGVWWLIEQVQLAREQVIDQLVVSGAASKREYMTALMTFADADRFTTLSTAFLRRRHLTQAVPAAFEGGSHVVHASGLDHGGAGADHHGRGGCFRVGAAAGSGSARRTGRREGPSGDTSRGDNARRGTDRSGRPRLR